MKRFVSRGQNPASQTGLPFVGGAIYHVVSYQHVSSGHGDSF